MTEYHFRRIPDDQLQTAADVALVFKRDYAEREGPSNGIVFGCHLYAYRTKKGIIVVIPAE